MLARFLSALGACATIASVSVKLAGDRIVVDDEIRNVYNRQWNVPLSVNDPSRMWRENFTSLTNSFWGVGGFYLGEDGWWDESVPPRYALCRGLFFDDEENLIFVHVNAASTGVEMLDGAIWQIERYISRPGLPVSRLRLSGYEVVLNTYSAFVFADDCIVVIVFHPGDAEKAKRFLGEMCRAMTTGKGFDSRDSRERRDVLAKLSEFRRQRADAVEKERQKHLKDIAEERARKIDNKPYAAWSPSPVRAERSDLLKGRFSQVLSFTRVNDATSFVARAVHCGAEGFTLGRGPVARFYRTWPRSYAKVSMLRCLDEHDFWDELAVAVFEFLEIEQVDELSVLDVRSGTVVLAGGMSIGPDFKPSSDKCSCFVVVKDDIIYTIKVVQGDKLSISDVKRLFKQE